MLPRPRTGALLGLVLSLLLLALPTAARAATSVGMNVGTLMFDRRLEARENSLLESLRRAGVDHVRLDAAWHWNEPSGPRRVTTEEPPILPGLMPGKKTTTTVHDFDWGTTDRLQAQLASHGLRWQPVLQGVPTWAQTETGNAHSRPRSVTDFARWAGLFAARYGSRGTKRGAYPVHRYEIWNEPNYTYFFRPKPSPVGYGALFVAAARAIRAADPSAVVVSAGLAPNAPTKFLGIAISGNPDMPGLLNDVAYHPYGRNVPTVIQHAVNMRRFLRARGLGSRPMSLNEVGWRGMHEGTDPGELPDTTRAGNYALSVDALAHSDCNVSTLDYYTWATAEEIPTYQPEWWGVVRRDGTLRTPAVAFAAAVRRARQARPALPICSGKPTRTPLRYGLKVLRKKGRCRAYRVTYRGYPINAIPVAGTDARRRKVGRITGKDGTVTLCGSKKGRLRVRAITGNWARSGWLRR